MPGGPPKFGEMTWLRTGGCPLTLLVAVGAASALVGSAMYLVATITGGGL